jgi:hypothetical protein
MGELMVGDEANPTAAVEITLAGPHKKKKGRWSVAPAAQCKRHDTKDII